MAQKLIFVEDDPSYGLIISTALEESGYQVDWIDNLNELPRLLQIKQPDLLLLDLEVIDRNSLDEIPSIHQQYPRLPIVVASSHTQGKEIVQCHEAGAKQYVKKPYDIDELLNVLHYLLPDILEIGDYRLHTADHQLIHKEDIIKLTPKEYQLICILSNQIDQVVMREQLFQQIWEGYIQEDSLNNLISSLRRYLKKDRRITVETIKNIGYRLSISCW